jgi:benzoate 4-monooxygenase
MAVIEQLASPWLFPAAAAALLAYSFVLPYFTVNGSLRGIPAPPTASVSNLWLFWTVREGNRYAVVDEVHKKLGPVVRIAPNHVSIADVDAINTIYGHGNGFLKS